MEKKAVKLSFLSKSNQTQLKSQNLTHQQTTQDLKGKMKGKKKKSTMKGRECKGAPPADLLVCFPSPAHISLTSKSIYSPARSTESPSRRHHQHHHHHHLTRPFLNKNNGQASPQIWSKTRLMGAENSEPTSPKVSCSGQIKIRPKPKPKPKPSKPTSTKNWQSLMEEIERLHNNKKHKKKHNGVDTFSSQKKDLMHFFSTCFHGSDSTSFGVEDDHQEEKDNKVHGKKSEGSGASKDIFSKWFMVLHENKNNAVLSKEERQGKDHGSHDEDEKECATTSSVHPPANALLLMRCRSAASKTLLEEKKEQEKEEESAKKVAWVVSELKDPFSKSQRWRRF